MKGRIYCIINLINKNRYIGKTIKAIKTRFNEHYKYSFIKNYLLNKV